jgi:hypothetical protein
MEKEIIFLVEEASEGGYTARAIGHNIFTEADSFAKLKRMVQDATQCHFETTPKMPRLIRLHMVKDEVIPVSQKWGQLFCEVFLSARQLVFFRATFPSLLQTCRHHMGDLSLCFAE